MISSPRFGSLLERHCEPYTLGDTAGSTHTEQPAIWYPDQPINFPVNFENSFRSLKNTQISG